MNAWIAVAVGGALGSVARHGVNRIVHQEWPLLRFPLATVVVNVVGCCVIGVLAGLVAAGRLPMRTNWREFVFVGILGGFTTFSAFSLETANMLLRGQPVMAAAYGVSSVAGSVLMLFIGLFIVRAFA